MRLDVVLVSTVLLTVAFLFLVPPMLINARTGRDAAVLATMDYRTAAYARLLGQFGAAYLAVILVAMIVLWTGYITKLRWAWFVVFVIVWGVVFPTLVQPSLVYFRDFSLIDWISWQNLTSWEYGPIAWVSIFILMLIALLLPIRSFFWRTGRSRSTASDSSATGA